MSLSDAMVFLALATVLGAAAVLLEAGFKAVERRRGLPTAKAMHPSAGEHRIRPARVDVGDSGSWEVQS